MAYFHKSESVIIGKYIVNWHEGDLMIGLVNDFNTETNYISDSLCFESWSTVNADYEVKESIDDFKKYSNPPFHLSLTGAEKTDIITFCTLSSRYQDEILPFEWEDVLITKKEKSPRYYFNYNKLRGLIRFAIFINEMEFEFSYTLNYIVKDVLSKINELSGCDVVGESYSQIENGSSIIRVRLSATSDMGHKLLDGALMDEIDGLTAIMIAKNDIDKIIQQNSLFGKQDNPKKVRKPISGRVRQNVLMRDNYTCQICGATVKDGAKLEIDHIKPVSKGGTNNENNLQVLCQQCNREKHNRDDLLHDKRKLAELEGK